MYDLRDLVAVGKSVKVVHTVTETDTATKYSKGLEELMSTPAMIMLAIQASAKAVDGFLPEGFISIGRAIEFEHTASTRRGMHITVEATVSEVQPLMITLDIHAFDDVGEIGFGRHRRSIVIVDKLIERSKKREAMTLNTRPL